MSFKKNLKSEIGQSALECTLKPKAVKGQSVVEYVVIFAIVVGLSWFLCQGLPAIFGGYVATATGAMQ